MEVIFTETEGARKESLLYLANGPEPGPDLVLWHRAALLDPARSPPVIAYLHIYEYFIPVPS